MKKLITVLIFVFVFAGMPAPQANAQANLSLQQQIDSLLAQIAVLQKTLEQRLSLQASEVFTSRVLQDGAVISAKYQVYDSAAFFLVKNSQHKEMIDNFLRLSPGELDGKFDEFVFFTREDRFDAFVETLSGTDSWRVGFNEELFDYDIDEDATTELLIHEIGHVVALEEFEGEEYLEIFRKTFWNENRSRQSFVSEYARDSIEEDFAENFLFFVWENNYRGVASEKVDFFRRYAKLRAYREEILSNL